MSVNHTRPFPPAIFLRAQEARMPHSRRLHPFGIEMDGGEIGPFKLICLIMRLPLKCRRARTSRWALGGCFQATATAATQQLA
ncbi:hypothetical protein BS47DRAFT_1102112 [Hydnum rufescens UP504]|uniref:Uncharacterized protein n=1 Tax=Hydnum rufescens UP504 TaxID=1448309 RepID=A0A9P6DSJ2_9AGAM|nr:hypothetical protein BS47DRAFT_1102112 [Hydnum rufescens UP504]